ncbi:uncharacterized protein LDX57_005099 [Aspergillus melleus]|uniref:uncharacterized protein n=1 Tax=Aspergillus melleus TaxID=138277 RepID=UPI001E8E71B4|nr:uncharacterized protein LDX57_005099 [Aspergillus melleus]KAH8427387.1 hypothetical protein LDX57_005099 [Aspergillus melleus]
MGRAAHQYSTTKVTLLQTALDCFITCSAVFPALIPTEEDDADGPENKTPPSHVKSTSAINEPAHSSSISSFVTVIRDIIDKNIDSLADDPFVSDHELDSKHESVSPYQFGKTLLMPPPLKVRKSQEELNSLNLSSSLNPSQIHSDTKQASTKSITHQSGRARRPPPLPIRIKPAETSHTDNPVKILHAPIPRDTQPAPLIVSLIPVTPTRGAAIRRYNSHLRFLRVQITNSIASLRTLVDEVTDLQESRRAAKNFRRSSSFWTFSPVKSPGRAAEKKGKSVSEGVDRRSSMETKEQRIIRLRADGWKTVGLRSGTSRWKGSEYYRRYCGDVLDELYLEA